MWWCHRGDDGVKVKAIVEKIEIFFDEASHKSFSIWTTRCVLNHQQDS